MDNQSSDRVSHPLSSPTSSSDQNQDQALISSIEQYKTQLDEVNTALESANEEDKVQLQELQLNLITILELTLNQLDQSQSRSVISEETDTRNSHEQNSAGNNFDEEFERFKLEIAKLDENNEDSEENVEEDTSGKLTKLESNLTNLEGQNVRAPFMERWGGYSYHNAVVLSLAVDDNQAFNYENPEVVVLFSEPTSPSMLPCRFFLEGRCKFKEKDCRFSHGKTVAVKDLREYEEPDRDKLVSGSRVLALHEGHDIWHRGVIEDVLENRSGFSFNCSVCGEVVEISLQSMVPLYADEDVQVENEVCDENGTVSTTQCSTSSEEEEREFVPNDVWLKNSLTTKLGDWEKFTKGIGSKLMAKMGYVVGTGLGRNGEGRVDPVTAYVYPQGVSLDHCMRLREASNGESVWEVEKRLLNEQKREEEKTRQREKFLKENLSVFDIINNKLSRSGDASSKKGTKYTMDVSNTCLKKDSTKELNRKNFQLSSRIEKLKEEVKTLNRSRERQSKDVATLKSIDKKLEERREELCALQKAEKQVETEQRSRKNMQKLFSF